MDSIRRHSRREFVGALGAAAAAGALPGSLAAAASPAAPTRSRFNGLRLSPHVFNTEADVDAALSALRAEMGAA